MNISDIMEKYTAGNMTLEEANKELFKAKAPYHLDPDKNTITEEEIRSTTIGTYPGQANGFGLLDTGSCSLDKVQVKDGKLVDCDCGGMYALFFIAGRMYHVDGSALTE